jgi:hypothetical protein
MEIVWHNWSQVEGDVRKWAQNPRLQPFGPWADPLAAALVVLQYAFMVVQAAAGPQQELLETWARMLIEGYKASDPATDAWERLVTMMVQAEPEVTLSQGWTIKKLGHESVAYQRSGDTIWRIPTQTQQLKERVGLSRDADVARQYGQIWVDRGWVIPDTEGKSTHFEAIPGAKVRVLLVPDDKLTNWNP